MTYYLPINRKAYIFHYYINANHYYFKENAGTYNLIEEREEESGIGDYE